MATPLLSVERVAYTYNDTPMELRRGQIGAAIAHLVRLLGQQPGKTLQMLGQTLLWAAGTAFGLREPDPQLGMRYAYADPATAPWEGLARAASSACSAAATRATSSGCPWSSARSTWRASCTAVRATVSASAASRLVSPTGSR